jgi:hypothetical protein
MGFVPFGRIYQGRRIKMPVMMLYKLRNGSFAHDLFFCGGKGRESGAKQRPPKNQEPFLSN